MKAITSMCIIIFLLLGIPGFASAEIIVYDQRELNWVWTPASGSPEFYNMYESVEGGPWEFVDTTSECGWTTHGHSQKTYQLKVQAGDSRGGIGPMSDESEPVLVIIRGDVSGNDEINAWDASMVLQYVLGTCKLNSIQQEAADVDKDGDIDSADAFRILQIAVGL